MSIAIADSDDRADWLEARRTVIGASDAASFAKESSVDKYVLAKLKSGTFKGNKYTADGDAYEPEMLEHFGIPHNTKFFVSAEEPGFGATPDGISDTFLAEVKVVHDRVRVKPPKTHWRQMQWQLGVMGPQYTHVKYIWRELVDGVPRRLEPHILVVERDEKEIERLFAIGKKVLAGVRAAQQFEKELTL